jgi:hypothetical protein
MKRLILLLMVLCSVSAQAQWSYETVDNGFDEPYKIAYTKKTDGAFLKLENIDGNVVFYIQGQYFCDEEIEVVLAFKTLGSYIRYTTMGKVTKAGDCIFIDSDLVNSEAVSQFLSCTTLKVKITEGSCPEQIYEFNMTGSTRALNFIK